MADPKIPIGKQIILARQRVNLSQTELARRCNLNVRTIQRIENGTVTPNLYTLRIIGQVLNVVLLKENETEQVSRQDSKIRQTFERRKKIRILTFVFALVLLAAAVILLALGIPKRTWAPFFYLIFFADLIVIGLTWRCPSCNALLGDAFNTKLCPRCGFRFYDEKMDHQH
jgi:transcriptional regulator with XRE-family HTH domain